MVFEIDRGQVLGLVMAIIFIVIGVVGANITNGAGKYVESNFATALGTNVSDIEIVSISSLKGILGASLTMVAVAVLGAAVGLMLYYLISSISAAGASAA